MFMENAVERAAGDLFKITQHIPAAIQQTYQERLQQVGFKIWWDNLGGRGQAAYQRLIRQPSAVPRNRWLDIFGDHPRASLDILKSTGVAAIDDTAETVIGRGVLFRRWVEENIVPTQPAPDVEADHDALDKWLGKYQASDFERLVIRILAAWARGTIEFPAAAIKSQERLRGDNQDLLPEAFFQMHALVSLLTHEGMVIAEPEPLSRRPQGRTDIKVRWRADPKQRACVEFKIFKRKDETVVKQVIDYSLPEDAFAVVISIDRGNQPMRAIYESRCFQDAPPVESDDPPAHLKQPTFLTKHERSGEGCGPLRVWHFLMQLSPD